MYPDNHKAPRLDTNMQPHFPQLVQGQYSYLPPVGQYNKLPGVQDEDGLQLSQLESQAPTTYLRATDQQKQNVMIGFAQNLFNNVTEDDIDDRVVEMVQDLEIVQALRSEQTTTKCNYMLVNENDRMCKKQVFTVQNNQNSVDSDKQRFMSLEVFTQYLTDLFNTRVTVDPAIKQFVGNALTALHNSQSARDQDLVQDEFELQDYPNGQPPPKLEPAQFTELTNGVADPAWLLNKVKMPKLSDEDPLQATWCQHFGVGSREISTVVSMVNGMISGNASPKQHLLQNFQYPGAFIVNMLLQDSNIVNRLPYLRQAVFGYHGLNLLMALPYDMAGYHRIGRDGSVGDFNRKIQQFGGFLKIIPIMIANHTDSEVIDPTILRTPVRKPRRFKPPTVSADQTNTVTEQSDQAEAALQPPQRDQLMADQDDEREVAPGLTRIVNQQLITIFKSLHANAKALSQGDLLLERCIQSQTYGMQEIYISVEGEYKVVDSLVKLSQSRSSNHSQHLLYCDLGQTHEEMKADPAAPVYASPPTRDTTIYGSNEKVFLNEDINKMWKAQTNNGQQMRTHAGAHSSYQDFLNYLNNELVDRLEVHPWMRLVKRLRNHPTYGTNLGSVPRCWQLIRVQVFALAVSPPRGLADAVLRQSRLVLANSEIVRHLQTFKSLETVQQAQQLINQVTNLADPHRFDNLQGNQETLQDLNTHYASVLGFDPRNQSNQAGSSVQPSHPEVRQVIQPRVRPSDNTTDNQMQTEVVQNNVANLSQEIQQEVNIMEPVLKYMLLDLQQRYGLLFNSVLPQLKQPFLDAMQAIQNKTVRSLPYYLFRSATQLNQNPVTNMQEYKATWSVSPYPLLVEHHYFRDFVAAMQSEHPDKVWKQDQVLEYAFQDTGNKSVVTLLSGLCRALIVYLQMQHPVNQNDFKTYVMVEKLIRNFAFGVLGIDLKFDVAEALSKCAPNIQHFVKGLLTDKSNRNQKYTMERLDEFKVYYRDQVVKTVTDVQQTSQQPQPQQRQPMHRGGQRVAHMMQQYQPDERSSNTSMDFQNRSQNSSNNLNMNRNFRGNTSSRNNTPNYNRRFNNDNRYHGSPQQLSANSNNLVFHNQRPNYTPGAPPAKTRFDNLPLSGMYNNVGLQEVIQSASNQFNQDQPSHVQVVSNPPSILGWAGQQVDEAQPPNQQPAPEFVAPAQPATQPVREQLRPVVAANQAQASVQSSQQVDTIGSSKLPTSKQSNSKQSQPMATPSKSKQSKQSNDQTGSNPRVTRSSKKSSVNQEEVKVEEDAPPVLRKRLNQNQSQPDPVVKPTTRLQEALTRNLRKRDDKDNNKQKK